MTAARKLSWNAVRYGNMYCAPACGRGCTFQEYETAFAKGKALAKRLGPDWRGAVWENLGWHFKAVSTCGRLKVHHSRVLHSHRGHYTAFLSEPGDAGGLFTGSGTTPQAAVAEAVGAAHQALSALHKLVEGL